MKKLFFSLLGLFLSYQASFADAGIFGSFSGGNAKASENALRNGDIHIDDIPVMIKNAIDFLMQIAGTISIIFIIV